MKKIIFKTFIIVSVMALSFSSCKNEEVKQQAIQQIPVVKVIKHDVPIYSEYVGQIYGQKDIPIRARVEGFLESIEFQEGSKVEKGQLLYTIDPQSLAAASNAQKSAVTAAQTQVSKAKADLERIEPLAATNAVSKSDLDAAQAAYDDAKANLNAARENLKSSNIDLSYTQVKSPLTGVIGKTLAKVGEFVGKQPNPVILNTVSKTDTIVAKFSVTEAQFLTISKRRIQKVKDGEDVDTKEHQDIDVQLRLADESIYDFKGKIDFVDRNIDESTGAILVQASFPNPDGLLRPGMYAKVEVLTDYKEDAIIVPQRCIMELQGQYTVFMVNDSNKVVSVPITVAYKSGDLAAITEGLQPGDRIVIDALQKVTSGMLINPVDTVFKSQVYSLEKGK